MLYSCWTHPVWGMGAPRAILERDDDEELPDLDDDFPEPIADAAAAAPGSFTTSLYQDVIWLYRLGCWTHPVWGIGAP